MLGNHEALWTLWEVSRAGTHAAAAARLGITPSAVGQQLKALEARVGVALFERVGRRARLTAAGAALVARLGEHLPALDAALEEASEAQRAVRGEVSLGGPWPFFRFWLRPRLPELLERHPELRLSVRFDVPSLLERRLLAGELDVALVGVPPEAPGLEVRPVGQEEFVAVASPAHVRRWGTPRTAREFAAQRFIAFDADLAMLGPWWRAAFGAREPLPTRVVCRIANLDEMLALAEAGSGIAVLPDYLVEPAVRAGRVVVLTPESGRRPGRRPRGRSGSRGAGPRRPPRASSPCGTGSWRGLPGAEPAPARGAAQSSRGSKSAFVAPQSGQYQSSGIASKAVPGAMPESGSPTAGS